MDLLHLCMKKPGFRFLNKLKFQDPIKYIKVHIKAPFFNILNRRSSNYDVVLITAHGSKDSILTVNSRDLNNQFRRYILLDDTRYFVNDFIFAVSCDTALEFGNESIKNGAIAYLGYSMKIDKLFSCNPKNVPKRIVCGYNIIFKKIFREVLQDNLNVFLQYPTSVNIFKERLSFNLEQKLTQLFKLNSYDIHQKYGVKITESERNKYNAHIVMKQLEVINEIDKHFVCLGDANFFYHGTVVEMCKRRGKAQTKNYISKLQFYNELSNQKYKQFVESLMC